MPSSSLSRSAALVAGPSSCLSLPLSVSTESSWLAPHASPEREACVRQLTEELLEGLVGDEQQGLAIGAFLEADGEGGLGPVVGAGLDHVDLAEEAEACIGCCGWLGDREGVDSLFHDSGLYLGRLAASEEGVERGEVGELPWRLLFILALCAIGLWHVFRLLGDVPSHVVNFYPSVASVTASWRNPGAGPV